MQTPANWARFQNDLAQQPADAPVAVLSYRVAMPRKPLRRLKQRSTTFRRR